MAVSATSHPWGAAIDTLPLTSDYSDEVVLLGRLKPGRVRESRRVVHVFPLASGARHATTLTARCGERAGTGDLQWLPGLTGMPCEYCMLDSLTER
jgi:hypothetical protein